jgi:DNA invertase Pin-like site-specific DNA recombinase
MRVAIYARVSTEDQTSENQLLQLRAWCTQHGHDIAREYLDNGVAGTKGTAKRKAFAQLFDDAARHRFDMVLFWSLDRFSREGMQQTITHLQRLDVCGVAWRSLTEPHLATDNELVRDILLALLSSLAKLEARKIRERTLAGLDRARARGKVLGRPKVAPGVEAAVRETLGRGNGILKTAKLCGCGVGTVQRIKEAMGAC